MLQLYYWDGTRIVKQLFRPVFGPQQLEGSGLGPRIRVQELMDTEWSRSLGI